jgi:type II secretory pathway pseudopilin PulG
VKKLFLNESGFSILEVLTTLVVSSVVGYSAIVSLPELLFSYERYQARVTFAQDIRETQARAITQGCRGLLTISSDLHTYQSGCDYLEYDTNNPPSSDTVFFTKTFPDKIFISADAPIIFNSKGQAIDANGDLNTVTVELSHSADTGHTAFSTGTLLGTGMFAYGD